MSRKLIIAANWKMNKGPAETVEFIDAFLPGSDELAESCDIVIAPPFVSLAAAGESGRGLDYWLPFVGMQVVLGPLVGLLVGVVGGRLVSLATRTGHPRAPR